MAPKRTVHTNARVENIKTMRAAAQQQLRELRSDLKKDHNKTNQCSLRCARERPVSPSM
jgi:hypothetical protein